MKRLLAIILMIAVMLAFFGCSKGEEAGEDTTSVAAETKAAVNPLTGEEGLSPSALGKRPVALVVENHPQARPQWGLDSADIIAEFEVEGGISRMLWLYADYTDLPAQVGPMRSARPPFVKFSELFDAVFIHWGGSHSSGSYIGGYETISADGVDDIDGMSTDQLFGRDASRDVSSEHTGVLYGEKLPKAIENKGFRTDIDDSSFSTFSFNKKTENAGESIAENIGCKFSSITDTREFTYSAESGEYSTSDWEIVTSFQNILVLMDNTEYITVPYQGSTTTYCNYSYSGGNGYYASNGTMSAITWSVDNGKLILKNEKGKELSINKGKTYIGLASSNNGGDLSIN